MRFPALVLAVCLWFAFHPHQAVARITYYESIELITAESDAMVRGTIVEINQLRSEGDPGPCNRLKLVIRVTETLKGPKSCEITVAFDSLSYPNLESWRKERKELLFSLQRWGGPHDPCQFASRSGYGSSIIELDGNGKGVVTMDFRVLTRRADILKAVREGVAAPPIRGEKKWWRLDPPPSSEVGIRAGINQVVIVLVPLDHRLEELGQRSANSKSVDYRALAPRALQPFKSDKNIAILKRLLSDDLYRDCTNAKGYGTRCYPARLPAYVILKSWGVAVEEPVTERPLRGLEDLVSGDGADFSAMDHALATGGINSSSAFSSRRFTPISTIPTAPPSPAGR